MFRLSLAFKIWKYRLMALLSLFGAYPTTSGYATVFMYRVFTGNCTDEYTVMSFDTKTKAIYIWAYDNPLYLQVSYDGTNYDTSIEVAADTLLKLSLSGLRARVINKVAGDVARYQLVAWHQIAKRRQ